MEHRFALELLEWTRANSKALFRQEKPAGLTEEQDSRFVKSPVHTIDPCGILLPGKATPEDTKKFADFLYSLSRFESKYRGCKHLLKNTEKADHERSFIVDVNSAISGIVVQVIGMHRDLFHEAFWKDFFAIGAFDNNLANSILEAVTLRRIKSEMKDFSNVCASWNINWTLKLVFSNGKAENVVNNQFPDPGFLNNETLAERIRRIQIFSRDVRDYCLKQLHNKSNLPSDNSHFLAEQKIARNIAMSTIRGLDSSSLEILRKYPDELKRALIS